jgi:hypothetical protein
MLSQQFNAIFSRVVKDYHITDNIDSPINNHYNAGSLEYLLYQKNWIDTVQWHLEDIVRDPSINPVAALQIKRRIDSSNQERTDMVERIDDYFLKKFADVVVQPAATFNTESPAWAIDRLSILALKIYHMQLEAERQDADEAHRNACRLKLEILLQQQLDLSTAIDELIQEIAEGKKFIKVYRQMKMYNDPSLNPVLYSKKN